MQTTLRDLQTCLQSSNTRVFKQCCTGKSTSSLARAVFLRTRTRAQAAPRRVPAPLESHVGGRGSRGASGPCHVTQAPASPRDGAGRGDAPVAAAEAPSRVRPAGEGGAGGGARTPGRPGARGRPILAMRQRGAGSGSPRKGGGRGVLSGGRPPAAPRELRRPRLGAFPPHPRLEWPLQRLCAQTPPGRARTLGCVWGGDPSPPGLGMGPTDPGLGSGAPT